MSTSAKSTEEGTVRPQQLREGPRSGSRTELEKDSGIHQGVCPSLSSSERLEGDDFYSGKPPVQGIRAICCGVYICHCKFGVHVCVTNMSHLLVLGFYPNDTEEERLR